MSVAGNLAVLAAILTLIVIVGGLLVFGPWWLKRLLVGGFLVGGIVVAVSPWSWR